jgi:hypothetical protein
VRFTQLGLEPETAYFSFCGHLPLDTILLTSRRVVVVMASVASKPAVMKGPDKQIQSVAADAIRKFLNRHIFLASPGPFLQDLEAV